MKLGFEAGGPSKRASLEGGIEGKTLRMEGNEISERATKNFLEHKSNLDAFKDLFKGLEGKWEYEEMLETLSARLALAGDLMEKAGGGMKEDDEELKKLGI